MHPVLQFNKFVRTPFAVEAVQITSENMADVAELIGELKEQDGVPFILINKRIVPLINRAHVGWWVTKFGDNYRCYSDKTFTDQFKAQTPEWEKWLTESETPVSVETGRYGRIVEPSSD